MLDKAMLQDMLRGKAWILSVAGRSWATRTRATR